MADCKNVPFCNEKSSLKISRGYGLQKPVAKLGREFGDTMSLKIGYARVSTDEQNLDLQIDALKAAGCDKVFQDHGISGITQKRKGLDRAISLLKEGDQLVVWKLDRLGRSLQHLVEFIINLEKKGCDFQSITEAMDTRTPSGKLLFHIAAAMGEYETSMNSERTKAGLKAARTRGQIGGRPRKLTIGQIDHARKLIEDGAETIASMARLFRCDKSTLWRALRR